MNISETIKAIMKANGMTQSTMATAIGKKRPNDVSARLNSSNLTFNNAIEMLSVMGYEVVVQKRTAGARGKDQFVIERGE